MVDESFLINRGLRVSDHSKTSQNHVKMANSKSKFKENLAKFNEVAKTIFNIVGLWQLLLKIKTLLSGTGSLLRFYSMRSIIWRVLLIIISNL